MACSCLPILDDGVCWPVVVGVIWRRAAGLHKQLGVVDGRFGLYLHVDLVRHIVLQRVQSWINHLSILAVWVELKLIGELSKAFIPHHHIPPVCCEALRHVPTFGVLAVELDLQQVVPGDQVVYVVHRGDFIFENQVFLIFLQS